MNYYKYVSGEGRVPLKPHEIEELDSIPEPIPEKDELCVLREQVERISAIIDALGSNSLFSSIIRRALEK